MDAQFPEIAGIVISMMYHQRGLQKSSPRIINFLGCLKKECVDGGFDLTQVITGMINNRRKAAKGDISCEEDGSSAHHSTISYKVAIKYA